MFTSLLPRLSIHPNQHICCIASIPFHFINRIITIFHILFLHFVFATKEKSWQIYLLIFYSRAAVEKIIIFFLENIAVDRSNDAIQCYVLRLMSEYTIRRIQHPRRELGQGTILVLFPRREIGNRNRSDGIEKYFLWEIEVKKFLLRSKEVLVMMMSTLSLDLIQIDHWCCTH